MSHPPRPPVGDVLDGLVAIVEQETAKLGNRDAWRGSSPERRLMAFPAEDWVRFGMLYGWPGAPQGTQSGWLAPPQRMLPGRRV